MKVIFEVGDVVEIEDNIQAGWCAARHVELIRKTTREEGDTSSRWVVKDVEGSDDIGSCEERFFHP